VKKASATKLVLLAGPGLHELIAADAGDGCGDAGDMGSRG
jgi:hypothetical protein